MASETELDAEDSWYSESAYREAIIQLGDAITPLQRRMLAAHADAPDCMLTVRQLATAGGYDKPNVTYSQYGRLGRLIAESLGVEEQWKVWTHFIGVGSRTEDGELIWEMHPELVDALVRLGWASRKGTRSSLDDIAQADAANELSPLSTQRDALIQARIGQGEFRLALLRFWGRCAVTGVSEPAVLRASHIKPWRESSNAERLDPNNGLLLAAHIDALFDAGLLTFEVDGAIRFSPLMADEDILQLGISAALRLRGITAKHEMYLMHHRKSVFRPG